MAANLGNIIEEADESTFCAVHPDRETGLRCNKCDRYMYAVRGADAGGYRCRQCVRQQDDKFFNAQSTDYLLAGAVCAVLGALAGFIVQQMGSFLIFVLLFAAPVGAGIGELALRATQRRRGRSTKYVAAAAVGLGSLYPLLVFFLQYGVFIPQVSVLVFAGIAAAAVYGVYQMRS